MDLADIRKKARGSKPGPVKPPRSPAPADTDVQLPVPVGAGELPPPAPRSGRDRLAELFEFPAEFDLATEESYLEGLEKQSTESVEDLRQWLTFSLGAEDYALDIQQISEIIKPREVTEIPRAPDFVLGVVSLRGIIVPIFDLGRRLRLAPAELSPVSRIIVCHGEGRSAGLLVDRINQVIRLPERSLEPPPSVLAGLDRDLLTGVGRYQERMYILLHLPSVLNAELV
ncbi:chemotaxis protein CheW [Desulfuromonas carbonis]|uniref:chemotaxis protein CheW n=1 Tax=Desulfuromonas sp. DDH964 TaxID=1823759 RepID=UPI00078C7EC0|nr:chemotaxis protein CheW [Desulfuromonas sp. DDH964]AMV72002.1 scaffold protein CheW associated with MCPs of class 40H [Desulfuromonas sp. DDH964]